jgi:hypothetical protein
MLEETLQLGSPTNVIASTMMELESGSGAECLRERSIGKESVYKETAAVCPITRSAIRHSGGNCLELLCNPKRSKVVGIGATL